MKTKMRMKLKKDLMIMWMTETSNEMKEVLVLEILREKDDYRRCGGKLSI